LFSLATFLSIFGPLVGITLGFDAISGEYANGTLSRVLSQPIYRDSLINGKFLAGLTTVAIFWAAILLIVIGLGITLLGFPPNGEELWRMLIFTAVGILYVGFWLALALLFSLLFQRTVTAALASLAVWLFLAIFVRMFTQSIASLFASTNFNIDTMISRISPNTLFASAVRILIDPGGEIFDRATRGQAEGILPTPLDLGQSLLLIWPHLTTLVAMVVICFGIAYIKFMRDEIRS
jgi:ABC-2 type transport system permease protein